MPIAWCSPASFALLYVRLSLSIVTFRNSGSVWCLGHSSSFSGFCKEHACVQAEGTACRFLSLSREPQQIAHGV